MEAVAISRQERMVTWARVVAMVTMESGLILDVFRCKIISI